MPRVRPLSRRSTLIQSHFLPFEARTLSRISLRVPYMKPLIKDRIRDYESFIAAGGTDLKFKQHIIQRYKDNNWKHDKDFWTDTVVFRMLKAVEKDYRFKNKQYESPWQKNKKIKDLQFQNKLDRTYEKYPHGRSYKSKREEYRGQ